MSEIPKDESFEERRKFCRFQYAEPVQLQISDFKPFQGSLSCDLSQGGLRVNLMNFLPVKSEITLQFPLTSEKMASCRGTIAWIQKLPLMDRYQAGLEFVEDAGISKTRDEIQQAFAGPSH